MMSERDKLLRVFSVTAGVRLAVALYLWFTANALRGDSADYHREAIELAELYAQGEVHWTSWIDAAWPQFVGLVYFLLGHSLLPIFAINAALAGATAVLLYRVAKLMVEERFVAEACAYVFAFFPSAVFFHAKPLKECAAAFAVMSLIWGVLKLNHRKEHRGWLWVLLGLVLICGLRVYLVPICVVCAVACLIPFRLRGELRDLFSPVVAVLLLFLAFCGVIYIMRIDLAQYEMLKYLDVNQLNYTRGVLSRGEGSMYDTQQAAHFGQGVGRDLWLAGKGIGLFVLGVDATNLRSPRQYYALSEMLLIVLCFPSLLAGMTRCWQQRPQLALPIMLFTGALVAVYSAGTTNLGALYRWRLQALPCMILFAVYGGYLRKNLLIYPYVAWFRQREAAAVRRSLADWHGRRGRPPERLPVR